MAADHLHTLIASLPPGDQAEVASYMAARSEAERREARYLASLPPRMGEMADDLSALLPEGMRFEWVSDA